MITLEEYKEHLINTYKYEIDNSEKKRIKRKEYLSKNYKDKYLNKIIKDTLKITKQIIEYKELNYYFIQLKEPYLIQPISLNLCGGWHADIIYEDINNNLISEYILKKIFGEKLSIGIKEKEYEFDTGDPDILSFDYEYFLYLQGIKDVDTKKLIKTKKK